MLKKAITMDDFVIVPVLALVLVWIAAVAYMIYKDHGIVEQIDGKPYYDQLTLRPSEGRNKLDLRNRFKKRFEK
jgi:hypothetical protein